VALVLPQDQRKRQLTSWQMQSNDNKHKSQCNKLIPQLRMQLQRVPKYYSKRSRGPEDIALAPKFPSKQAQGQPIPLQSGNGTCVGRAPSYSFQMPVCGGKSAVLVQRPSRTHIRGIPLDVGAFPYETQGQLPAVALNGTPSPIGSAPPCDGQAV